MITTLAISQNWPKKTHWLWRTISSWNNGRKGFSLTFVEEKLQSRTTVDQGRWFWRQNYGRLSFTSNFIVTGDPRASPSPLWLTHAWRTYTRLQASEERERERERAPASKSAADFVSNYLRYGVFWRRFSTEHFLSDLFSLIFRHVGSISIRILGFCFTEFFFPEVLWGGLRLCPRLDYLPQLWICEHSGMFFPSCAYCYVFRFPCKLDCLTNVS